MKVLLTAINAKYIHSNLGVYCLKAYADEMLQHSSDRPDIEICEYTINNQMEKILGDLYRRKPDVAAFSCYIWNIAYVRQITADLKKVLPDVKIWLGGPEVSYDARKILEEWPQADGVMIGEGEETFAELLDGGCFLEENGLTKIAGLAFRKQDGSVCITPPRPVMDLSKVPFVYQDLERFHNRILYYESSRGCPFSCSYCLSSIDKSVRFRDLDLVREELGFFLEHNVPQVKFVDRTFNCKKSHSMAIWQYISDHDNGVTNFHFEIAADLLDQEELELLAKMRPGLIQLEIGVQTTNPVVVKEIRRTMDLDKVARRVAQVNAFCNIHQHLDLIAGLPYEDIESFHRSFNDVYKMEPEQLQLGFLKVLKGSYMEEMKQKYGLLSQSRAPYEVLRTNWLSYEEVIRLKGVEEMVEVYYNSGQFRRTMKCLSQEWGDAFELYDRLAAFYEDEDRLLECLFVGLSDTHNLADGTHLCTQLILYALELLKCPACKLDNNIVAGRNILIQSAALAAWNLIQSHTGCQHRRYQRNRETSCLGCQCGRTGGSRVDLDNDITVCLRVMRPLYVGTADYLDCFYDLVGFLLQTFLYFFRNG